jgi:hypothetical protein
MRPGPSTHAPYRPHVDPSGWLLGDVQKYDHGKIVKGEHGKK